MVESLSKSARSAERTAGATAGSGIHANPLRLSETDGAVAARRLAGKYQTGLPEGLELRMKKRGKRVAPARIRLAEAHYPNQRWSMDFVSDRLEDGDGSAS